MKYAPAMEAAPAPPPLELTAALPRGDRLVVRGRALEALLSSLPDEPEVVTLLVGSTETDHNKSEVTFIVDSQVCGVAGEQGAADGLRAWAAGTGRQAWAVGLCVRSSAALAESVIPRLRKEWRRLLPPRTLLFICEADELRVCQWDSVRDSMRETDIRFRATWTQLQAAGYAPFDPYFVGGGDAGATARPVPAPAVPRTANRKLPAPPKPAAASQVAPPAREVGDAVAPVATDTGANRGGVSLKVRIPSWAKVLYLSVLLTATALLVIHYMAPVPRQTRAAPVPAVSPAVFGLRVTLRDQVLEIEWNPDATGLRAAGKGTLTITDGRTTKHIELSNAQLRSGRMLYLPEGREVVVSLSAPSGASSVQESLRVVRTAAQRGAQQ